MSTKFLVTYFRDGKSNEVQTTGLPKIFVAEVTKSCVALSCMMEFCNGPVVLGERSSEALLSGGCHGGPHAAPGLTPKT